MKQQHNGKGPGGGDSRASRAQTTGAAGDLLSTPSIQQNPSIVNTFGVCQEPDRDALESALSSFWSAWDKHDYAEADQAAAQYRQRLRGATMSELTGRLSLVEKRQEQDRAELADLARRLANLEGAR